MTPKRPINPKARINTVGGKDHTKLNFLRHEVSIWERELKQLKDALQPWHDLAIHPKPIKGVTKSDKRHLYVRIHEMIYVIVLLQSNLRAIKEPNNGIPYTEIVENYHAVQEGLIAWIPLYTNNYPKKIKNAFLTFGRYGRELEAEATHFEKVVLDLETELSDWFQGGARNAVISIDPADDESKTILQSERILMLLLDQWVGRFQSIETNLKNICEALAKPYETMNQILKGLNIIILHLMFKINTTSHHNAIGLNETMQLYDEITQRLGELAYIPHVLPITAFFTSNKPVLRELLKETQEQQNHHTMPPAVVNGGKQKRI